MAKDAAPGGQWIQTTCSAADLAVLFGINLNTLAGLVRRDIVKPAEQPHFYMTIPSVHGYLGHLREQAQGRGSDANLAGERAKGASVERQIKEIELAKARGEVLPLPEIAEEWARLATSFKGAVLAMPGRARAMIPHLTAHDQETLRQIAVDILIGLAEEIEVGAVGADPEQLQISSE